jgi:hypothetical protein
MALYWVDDPNAWLEQQVAASDEGSEAERRNEISQNWDWYDNGTGDEIERKTRDDGTLEPNDNITAKLFKTTIDHSKGRFIGDGRELVTFKTERQRRMFQAWSRANRWISLLTNMVKNGSVGGHVFVLESINDDGQIEYTVHDPQCVTVIFDPDNYRRVIGYVINWNTGEVNTNPRRKVIWRETAVSEETGRTYLTNHWHIDDYIAHPTDQPVRDGQPPKYEWVLIESYDWPNETCPMVEWQNVEEPNRFYGSPDVDQQDVNLIRSFNRHMSHASMLSRAHSDPLIYAAEVPFASDTKTLAPSAGENMLTNWRRDAKAFNSVQGGHANKELRPSDIVMLDSPEGFVKALEIHGNQEGILQLCKAIRELFHFQTSTINMTPDTFQHLRELNNKAMRMFWGHVEERVKEKRVNYEHGISELVVRIMHSLGETSFTHADVIFSWPPVLPVNDAEELSNAQKEMEIGVSAKTRLEKLGHRYDDEAAQREKEALAEAELQAKVDKILGKDPESMARIAAANRPESDKSDKNANVDGQKGGESA